MNQTASVPMPAFYGGRGKVIAVRRRGRLAGFLTFVIMLVVAGYPGQAAVLEIGSQGEVARRDGELARPADAAAAKDENGALSAAAAVTNVLQPALPARYASAVQAAAAAANISPHLLSAVVWQESRWHSASLSRAGAIGLAQLMPSTARALSVNPSDPVASLFASARLLRQELDQFGGRLELALAAYNAGPARVARAGAVPPIAETKAYVAAILDRLSRIS